MKLTTQIAVLKLLQSLDTTKAVGIDNISGRFLKDGASLLADSCYLSIKLAVFPEKCKIDKLKTLFKKGNKLEPKNYRPISLLPLVSKIFEKIIQSQTQPYLNSNKISIRFS